MRQTQRSWTTGKPVTSPFAAPRGLSGRLAGRFMLLTNKQDELLDVLRVNAGDDVLEIGHGPGGLIRLLAEKTDADHIYGVDPSAEMVDAAGKLNAAAVAAGRVTLRIGAADDIGLPGESVDCAVSVNNVAIWPDLEAGIGEIHRVLRIGGRAVICWHGGHSAGRIARSLALPADHLDRIGSAIRDRFGAVTRDQLADLDVFTAIREN
ncbi:class I SAM-dependent methyltransferase [Fodinicola acaciae]|uniref:class I SAM-dependent methyltransferase n=1 Tax=Fodinicola acaciae TaxID=2681555 RepID=UPI0013D6163B|nr:methyltransferase domain-containing protein [Fodinicola acaciae]